MRIQIRILDSHQPLEYKIGLKVFFKIQVYMDNIVITFVFCVCDFYSSGINLEKYRFII